MRIMARVAGISVFRRCTGSGWVWLSLAAFEVKKLSRLTPPIAAPEHITDGLGVVLAARGKAVQLRGEDGDRDSKMEGKK